MISRMKSLARCTLTLETNAITLQAVHGLLEERLARRGHTGDIVLLPLNGSIDVLENLFYRVRDFCAYTVTRDEGDLHPDD